MKEKMLAECERKRKEEKIIDMITAMVPGTVYIVGAGRTVESKETACCLNMHILNYLCDYSRDGLDHMSGSNKDIRREPTEADRGDKYYNKYSSGGRRDREHDPIDKCEDWEDSAANNSTPFGSSYNKSGKDKYSEWSGSRGPVPIPVQQARRNMPMLNNYTSLKRSHSNVITPDPLTAKVESNHEPANQKNELKKFTKVHTLLLMIIRV